MQTKSLTIKAESFYDMPMRRRAEERQVNMAITRVTCSVLAWGTSEGQNDSTLNFSYRNNKSFWLQIQAMKTPWKPGLVLQYAMSSLEMERKCTRLRSKEDETPCGFISTHLLWRSTTGWYRDNTSKQEWSTFSIGIRNNPRSEQEVKKLRTAQKK